MAGKKWVLPDRIKITNTAYFKCFSCAMNFELQFQAGCSI